ncbi:hypothetical protein BYT27DRAFT_6542902 [Phlegmacium glaucopus]|nr:hypothetical protein BYT27DRAFT_6542902 [Phlegmacium glaucopus]
MAQEPRTLHLLVNDAMNYSLFTEKVSRVMGNPKRYGIYFPSKASIIEAEQQQQHDASDNDSTWEFCSPVSLPSPSSSHTSCRTSSSTPAQEIVIRYRAGISLGPSDSRSSAPSQYSEPDHLDNSSLASLSDSEYAPVAPEEDIKAKYRQSRQDALLNTYEEAAAVVASAGLGPNKKICCHRPGCRDTLANIKALMYHLHIHDIHDRFVLCPRCKGSYEGQREFRMHNCPMRSQSPPTSPLQTFRRILTKFSF